MRDPGGEKEKLELGDINNVYLVGIGGAGMSAIATVLMEMGYGVCGSDIKESPGMLVLRKKGAVVGVGHRAENLGSPDLVVVSSAISDTNTEVMEARRRGIPIVSRAEMLSALMDTKVGIAVAGTHGKTTTTSMVASVLSQGGLDPTYLVGGELNDVGANARYGKGEYLVAEADESDGSFLLLNPKYSIVTNIEGDHLDYFGTIENAKDMFLSFLRNLSPEGVAVVCGDQEESRVVAEAYVEEGGKAVLFGSGSVCRYRMTDMEFEKESTGFTLEMNGDSLGKVELTVPGKYNLYNALAAASLGLELGMDFSDISRGLSRFGGVRRRFERVGERSGIRIIDDYAHHPTEVEAVLKAARAFAKRRLVAVFQPHRYTRTQLLHERFGSSLGEADLVIITDVYAAGEFPLPGVSGKLILDSLLKHFPHKDAVYLPRRADLKRHIPPLLREGDLMLTLGAGDITGCGREIMEELSDKGSFENR